MSDGDQTQEPSIDATGRAADWSTPDEMTDVQRARTFVDRDVDRDMRDATQGGGVPSAHNVGWYENFGPEYRYLSYLGNYVAVSTLMAQGEYNLINDSQIAQLGFMARDAEAFEAGLELIGEEQGNGGYSDLVGLHNLIYGPEGSTVVPMDFPEAVAWNQWATAIQDFGFPRMDPTTDTGGETFAYGIDSIARQYGQGHGTQDFYTRKPTTVSGVLGVVDNALDYLEASEWHWINENGQLLPVPAVEWKKPPTDQPIAVEGTQSQRYPRGVPVKYEKGDKSVDELEGTFVRKDPNFGDLLIAAYRFSDAPDTHVLPQQLFNFVDLAMPTAIDMYVYARAAKPIVKGIKAGVVGAARGIKGAVEFGQGASLWAEESFSGVGGKVAGGSAKLFGAANAVLEGIGWALGKTKQNWGKLAGGLFGLSVAGMAGGAAYEFANPSDVTYEPAENYMSPEEQMAFQTLNQRMKELDNEARIRGRDSYMGANTGANETTQIHPTQAARDEDLIRRP